MRLFQSERRLSQELSKIMSFSQEKILSTEQKILKAEEDFLVYLDSDLEIENIFFQHYEIRDGNEVVLRF